MGTHSQIWNESLRIIRDNISEGAYNTWFSPIIPLQFANNDFTIQVPSPFFYEYIEEHYADLIYRTLMRVTGEKIALSYKVIVDDTDYKAGHTTLPSEHTVSLDVNKQAATGLNQAPNDLYPPSIQDWRPNLNPKLNFNNFFEGPSNEVARSIAMKISEDPTGKNFNPCFIFGCSGVGKTHLCHAIGNRIVEMYPQKKVLYISAHLFEVQFTDARKKNTHNEFVHFYQGVDVLILDDIHELAGKEKTQQAYFHIFNHLKLIDKQLILTADTAPAYIEGLEERIVSRLQWGATLEMKKPDLELRKKILRNKIKQDGYNISEEIVDYIATNVTDHARDLEGVITSLAAHAVVYNLKEIDLNLAKQIVGRTVKQKKRQITIENIQNVVSQYFQITPEDIHSASRKREIVQARQLIMFLAKKYTHHSCEHIGRMVGKRDHATVTHAIKTIENSLQFQKGFTSTMNDLETLLMK